LYGKYDLLDKLPAYKVRPADNKPPYKFETGTQNHEGIAGTLAAVEYIASLGGPTKSDRRSRILAGIRAIEEYEQVLIEKLVKGLQQVRGLKIYGITDSARFAKRVPTVSFRLEGFTPREVAEYLGQKGIFVWDGNYYALAVTERLEVEQKGGMVRVGPVHYNTAEEIERLVQSLQGLVHSVSFIQE
jgi:selenocysteine lyase/cysteine desulfurase